jgi:hypothetical protein
VPVTRAVRIVRPARSGIRLLLLPRVAAEARAAEMERLRALFGKVPLIKPDDRRPFDEFCAATAERRVRERQILVVAYLVVAVLVTVPSVGLLATTVRSRPAELLGYFVATVALTLPAGLALRGRRVFSPLLMAGFSVAVCAAVWTGSDGTAWWNPRWMFLAPSGDRERLTTGIALGAALTLVLILFALLCRVALILIMRSRFGGGAPAVRVFDHLLSVIDLLGSNGRPGDDRRAKIDDGLRMAEATLAVMARGGRPSGWRSRRHRRELKDQHKELGRRLRGPNPLLGLPKADKELLDWTATCLLALCRDELADALRTVEETPTTVAEPGPSTGRRLRLSAEALRRCRKLAGLLGPTVIFAILLYVGFPMPAVVVGILGAFCAVVLVIGSFWTSYPDPAGFFEGLSTTMKDVKDLLAGAQSLLQSARGGPAEVKPGEGTGPTDPPAS